MDGTTESRTLTDAEASRYIGMSTSWLRQSRMRGDPQAPPYVKIGRSVRYLRDDLDGWLEQHRRPCRLSNNTLAHDGNGPRPATKPVSLSR